MPVSKQQIEQERLRRASLKAPSVNTPSVNLQQKIQQEKLNRSVMAEKINREKTKRGLNQQKPNGFKGLAQNFKTDFGSFAKGMLGLGRQAITHPVDSAKVVGGLGSEIVKGIPQAVQSMGHDIANYGEVQRKGIEAWKQLSQIPLDKQKEMLAAEIQKIGESQQAKDNPDKRRLAQLGMGILGNYAQYSRFKEKVYNEPFSAALDILPTTKALGVNKLVGKGASVLNKIPAVAKTTEKLADSFQPLGKLKRLGYGNVAEDVAKTESNIRRSQQGIIQSTVKKFEKDFKLSKAEKTDFFETIDKGRRTPGYVPVSTNPKVQKAIDWYLNKELPKIQKGAGYISQPLQEARKGEIPGRMSIINKEGNLAEIDRIDVAKSERGKGYGRKLISDYFEKNPEIDTLVGSAEPGSYGFWKKIGAKLEKPSEAGTAEELSGFKLKRENFIKSQPLQEGVSNAPIENYLHHFFSPTKETKFGGKLSSPSKGYLKQSTDVKGFVKDPVVSIAGVKSKIATANIKQGFIDRVFKRYATDNVQEFKNGKAINELGEEMAKYKGRYLPKDLADELTRIETGEPGWLKTILAPARSFNRNWKPLATAVRPRYHLRNIIGNVYNASFVGGAKLRRYPEALFQQIKGNIAQNMKDGTISGKIYKTLFKEAPEHKYIKMAAEDDLIGRGFFSVDINDMAEVADTVEDFSKMIAKMDTPAMVYKIPILKQWMNTMQKFGSAIEDNARLSLYIDQLKKGASRTQAKAYVNKHLFDYLNGLGDADKVIKAVIPFWSWTRFNVPLQFGAMAKNPLRHLAVQEFGKPYVQQNEANNLEYKYLSQREKDMGAIKTGETTKDGTVYDKYMRTQGVLPIQDVLKISDPDNIGFSPMYGMLNQLSKMVNPPASPQENLDYYGKPVESFPGEVKRYMSLPVRGTGKEIAQSIPLLSELNKLVGGSYDDKSRPDLSSRVETVLSPTSSTLQDREKNRQYFESDYQRKYGTGTMQPGYLTELKYVAKNVIENPKDAVSVKNFRTLINLMKEGGMNDAQIKQEIEKAVQAQLKKESPKPKRPSSLRPQKPSPALDPYYAEEIKKRASSLSPYFSR